MKTNIEKNLKIEYLLSLKIHISFFYLCLTFSLHILLSYKKEEVEKRLYDSGKTDVRLSKV